MARIQFDLDTSRMFSLSNRKRAIRIALTLVLIAAMLFGSILLIDRVSNARETQPFNDGEYNIVFLDNNLFYFCQLEELNNEYLKCNNPYYLVRREETQEDGTKQEKVFVRQPSAEEIYEPEGAIFLRKERVVYIAKVGSDSAVLKFINKQGTTTSVPTEPTNDLPQVIEEIPLQ